MREVQFTVDAVYQCLPVPIIYKKGTRHEMRDDMAARWVKRNVAVYVPPRSPVEFNNEEQAAVVTNDDPVAPEQDEAADELPPPVVEDAPEEVSDESEDESADEPEQVEESNIPEWMKKLNANVAAPVTPAKRPYNRRK